MNTLFERGPGNKPTKDEWFTPPNIIKALGEFDLDPCGSINPPFVIAKKTYTEHDNGLLLPWHGRVFCNPPYGIYTGSFLEKCAIHNNCIALVFARTETNMFFNYVYPYAHSIFFFKGRIKFYQSTSSGPKQMKTNSGAPSCLIAYGPDNTKSIIDSRLPGFLINLLK